MAMYTLMRNWENDDYEITDRKTIFLGNTEPGRLSTIIAADSISYWVSSYNLEHDELVVHRIGGDGNVLEEVRTATDEMVYINASFQTAFAAAGDRFATVFEYEGLRIYDFNRATGQFSNLRTYPLPDSSVNTRGVIFSPNGRYVYTTFSTKLYQTDVVTGHSILIARHENARDETGWPIAMGNMRVGPDCRIYVGPSATTDYFHVIHSPDEEGLACDFQFRAIRTPTWVSFQLPNVPMTLDPAKCRDLPWILSPPVSNGPPPAPQLAVRVFPNPAREVVRLAWPRDVRAGSYRWRLYSMDGRLLRDYAVTNEAELRIDRQGLPPESYVWELTQDGIRAATGLLVLR
jgi:hypothetical protein